MNKPYITLTITDLGGNRLQRVQSRKSKRIFYFIQADKFAKCMFELSVRYQKEYVNSGTYHTKEKLLHALRAFLEE